MEDPLADRVARAARKAWQDALGVDDVAPDDDFFEFGGQSVIAIRLVSMLRRDVDADVKVRVLLQNPRFDDFVRAVVAHKTSARDNNHT